MQSKLRNYLQLRERDPPGRKGDKREEGMQWAMGT